MTSAAQTADIVKAATAALIEQLLADGASVGEASSLAFGVVVDAADVVRAAAIVTPRHEDGAFVVPDPADVQAAADAAAAAANPIEVPVANLHPLVAAAQAEQDALMAAAAEADAELADPEATVESELEVDAEPEVDENGDPVPAAEPIEPPLIDDNGAPVNPPVLDAPVEDAPAPSEEPVPAADDAVLPTSEAEDAQAALNADVTAGEVTEAPAADIPADVSADPAPADDPAPSDTPPAA